MSGSILCCGLQMQIFSAAYKGSRLQPSNHNHLIWSNWLIVPCCQSESGNVFCVTINIVRSPGCLTATAIAELQLVTVAKHMPCTKEINTGI